ncbi:MAG: SIS domain-containing protein [Elusimicrobiaceae bacterium]|jgi:D-sedoheptulose 7-phosphate isomerase
MKAFAGEFFETIYKCLKQTECAVTDDGLNFRSVTPEEGTELFFDEVKKAAAQGNKVLYIGNGGSASIASHMSVDLWKNGKIKSLCFNDPSMLTCLGNDLGYENVFSAPTESFADKGDVFVSISSSGKSPNIINASKTALKKGCSLVTFSGFSRENPLMKMGKINFYVPSNVYGIVETVHSALCHAVVNCIIEAAERKQ